jgi:hypothetical protein
VGRAQKRLKTQGDSASRDFNATKNATTARERQEMTDDDMLLALIEGWPDLTTARRRMIVAIVRANGSGTSSRLTRR